MPCYDARDSLESEAFREHHAEIERILVRLRRGYREYCWGVVGEVIDAIDDEQDRYEADIRSIRNRGRRLEG